MKFHECKDEESGTRSMLFECPGCGCLHIVHVSSSGRPVWTFNDDVDKPTISPSLLVRWDQWFPAITDEGVREKIKSGEIVQEKKARVCHSFIKDGMIQFLEDCTHRLAGTTVEIPEWDEFK